MEFDLKINSIFMERIYRNCLGFEENAPLKVLKRELIRQTGIPKLWVTNIDRDIRDRYCKATVAITDKNMATIFLLRWGKYVQKARDKK